MHLARAVDCRGVFVYGGPGASVSVGVLMQREFVYAAAVFAVLEI